MENPLSRHRRSLERKENRESMLSFFAYCNILLYQHMIAIHSILSFNFDEKSSSILLNVIEIWE